MKEFYHYLYYWLYKGQQKICKVKIENDTSLCMSLILLLNYYLITGILTLLFRRPLLPAWLWWWIPSILIVLGCCIYFDTNRERKQDIIQWGDSLSREKKKRKNFYCWMYVVFSVLLLCLCLFGIRVVIFHR